MRNISFALTTPQFYRRRKTVTRRMGWTDVKPGQLLCGVVKGMGLRPGETIQRLAIIRVNEPSREKLSAITPEDVEAEGFPGMTPTQFIRMFCDSHESCRPSTIITRIPYAYVPGGRFTLPGFCRFCGDRAAATSTKCSKCEFVDQFSESLKHD